MFFCAHTNDVKALPSNEKRYSCRGSAWPITSEFESNEHKREMRRTTVIDVQYAEASAA
jgi:hypothetical protein